MSDTLCKHGWSLRFCEPCSTAAFMASVKGPGDGGMLAMQRELTALRAENEKLRAALEMFACDCVENDLCKFSHACRNYVARAALGGKDE